MKRNFLYITYLFSSLLAITACSKDDNDIPVDQKTPIQLSVGSVSGTAVSRAITVAPTSENGLSYTVFDKATDLYLVMKSEKGSDAKWTMTKGNVAANAKDVTFGDGFKRYWDDCYARDAKLSVYGICTPGTTPKITTIGGKNTYSHTATPTTGAWEGDYQPSALTIADWSVSTEQTAATVANEDLCYSNNLSQYTVNSANTDARLYFNQTSKQFTGGNMNFYHALSKITFVVQKGESFTEDEFKFATGTNIAMKGMNISNPTFNIESGEFNGTYGTGNITKMYQRSFENNKYTLDALVLPGTDMSDATNTDAISFTMNGNVYKLTKAALLAQISETDRTNKMLESKYLKPGVHYTFNLTISKTQVIKITASLVDWETVEAENLTPSNARISITTTKGGTDMTDAFDLYRLQDASDVIDTYQGYNWSSNYSDKASVTYADSKWTLSPNWYWDNNKTYYHFRSIAPTNLTVSTTAPLTSAEIKSASETFQDVLWGAPFVSGITQFTYDKEAKGFDGTGDGHQIFYAIGPTNSDINLTMFHMMSKVHINLATTDGDDKVTLSTGTKITLKSIKKSGTVAMGNGLVTTTGEATDWKFTQTPSESSGVYSWSAGIVPQSLDGVVLEIITPDNNKYEIALKDVVAKTVTANNISIEGVANDAAITYWYPCFEYTYTITLKKTGIEKITATLVDWQKVNADNQDVQIK